MRIDSLELDNFRNYGKLKLDFSSNINIFTGENGHGKTNLLEGILLAAAGRSFRAQRDEEMIRWGSGYFLVRGFFSLTGGSLRVDIMRNGPDKKLIVNGCEEKKIAILLNYPGAVVFHPDDLKVLKESPSDRRRYLNIMISQLYPKYYAGINSLRRLVMQRNALLKKFRKCGKWEGNEELDVLDSQLAVLSGQIMNCRMSVVKRLSEKAAIHYREISGGKDDFRLDYNSSFTIGLEAEGRERELKGVRREEIRRGITLIGPHRDDLIFDVNGQTARSFASQGQQRTAILAAKLAELELIREIKGEYPLFLLDDVFSELDEKRREYLVRTVSRGMQTFITATDLHGMDSLFQEKGIFRVQEGKIF